MLIIGSGPIVIGQAAEFDYAGTQACKALRGEGFEVVLVNSNPATIMTDDATADRVYIEPLTADAVAEVIERERPDALLPTMGGQTGLNLAVSLEREGVLDRFGVRILGTPLQAIRLGEDRGLFKSAMEEIGEPVPPGGVAGSVAAALELAGAIGYPVVVRPAYTLGGTGGGRARNPEELARVAARGLDAAPTRQVLVEKGLFGWKEIEYEVMRDATGSSVAVCGMENVDPMGIHTGDSIVVAPPQTLTGPELRALRAAALRIAERIGIIGAANVQFAQRPDGPDYYVIEVNPRVSRSSALASKATGYPIARVAALLAAGRTLDSIENPVTGRTLAGFEPALDYVVVKIPRWPFDKFGDADRTLGAQMKATGEVMAIERGLEAALMKAVRSLDVGRDDLRSPALSALPDAALAALLDRPSDVRLFAVAEALRRGWPARRVSSATGFDPLFVQVIGRIVDCERDLAARAPGPSLLCRAKRLGYSDRAIGRLAGRGEDDARRARLDAGILPGFRAVGVCAGGHDAAPYYYSSYDGGDRARGGLGPAVVVLGSGPIRIGQGIEFDHSTVHAVEALREAGIRAVVINNNPETVSTDFDVADALYFEPLTLEDILNVIEVERPLGALVQFGGQTAVALAGPLAAAGVPILGTSADAIDVAEDRRRFDALVARLGIPRPPGAAVTGLAAARRAAAAIGYPVVVRPSYVLGGRAMRIVSDRSELDLFAGAAFAAAPGRPALIDRYLPGHEVEVDAVSDGRETLVAGIMEHVERAGVHSGDSIAIYPAMGLRPDEAARVVDYTCRIARALGARGMINLQFVVHDGTVFVLEANLRSSRTVPFIVKATGLPLVRYAVRVALGGSLARLGAPCGLWPARPGRVAVKAPVFSFAKLPGVDPALGPEMKSTGEVMGCGPTVGQALRKALAAAGMTPGRTDGRPAAARAVVLWSLAARDRGPAAVRAAQAFRRAGYELAATMGTAEFLRGRGVEVRPAGAERPTLAVVTPTRGGDPARNGFALRQRLTQAGVPCLTALDTASALAAALAGGPREG